MVSIKVPKKLLEDEQLMQRIDDFLAFCPVDCIGLRRRRDEGIKCDQVLCSVEGES
jgi:hypothetical protein